MAHLRPCPVCACHVRANETTCPFCDAKLAVDEAVPSAAPERLGRAARMAFSAAAITVAACDSSPKKENIAMPYGAPPDRVMPDTGAPIPEPVTATADASPPKTQPDAGTAAVPSTSPPNIVKPYGAPPRPDPLKGR